MEKLLVFNTVELCLAGVTFLLFIIQLLYYLVVYTRPLYAAEKTNSPTQSELQPVSIIVYAKNAAENLKKCLPSLLSQDYPHYEVIVVNDGSSDETEDILKLYKNKNEHLYHTYIPHDDRYMSRKKLALTLGIKAAKHEILLFTEANCHPLSDQWIRCMTQKYQPGTEIILGFCAYGNYKGFMQKFIAYDNLRNGLQYISAALANHPYTGNGCNLSYSKKLFFQHKDYYKSFSFRANDDDLFINQVATAKNVQVEYSADSIIEMGKIEQVKNWKETKTSRAATYQYYRGGQLFFYQLETISFFLFVLVVIASIAFGISGNWLISVWSILLYLGLFTTKAIVLHKSAKLLQQKPITGWLPFLELIQPLFNLHIRIHCALKKKNDFTMHLGM
ncbi:glycosyltransferase [Parabacteroides bouchesdurhonensis]|uniref:glycosyltransferase n=1 Tax=Parabacteroides bouchesdurhonensis TaxID=1936995 RepID=UPI000C85D633|nr:glycosyltransferase [Parabacteroides bouchesdurhonensis]